METQVEIHYNGEGGKNEQTSNIADLELILGSFFRFSNH